MSIWQLIDILLLALAITTGKPRPMLTVAMVFNLLGSMAMGPVSELWVGLVDLITVVSIIGLGRKEKTVCWLFAAMIPVYMLGHMLELSPNTTYAGIDLIAYVQFAVIGGWSGGLARLLRLLRRGRPAFSGAVVLQDHPSQAVGRIVQPVAGKRVSHGR